MDIKNKLSGIVKQRYAKTLERCDSRELYYALLQMTQELSTARPAPQGSRKLYYFSAEFLVGKLLSNNLLALGV